MKPTRRQFIRQLGLGAAGIGLATCVPDQLLAAPPPKKLFFDISLAQFSLVSSIWKGKLTTLEFPAKAKNDFGIDAVEYVNSFWKAKATDQQYLNELKQRTDDLGVRNVLIMVDGEGNVADLDEAKRKQAVENHHKWVEAAKFLGCHAIRVNLGTMGEQGDPKDVAQAAVDGYGRLVEYGAAREVSVIVENHFGLSTNGAWLAGVMKQVNHPYAGTLPDFGNFCTKITMPQDGDWTKATCEQEYDRYKGMAELMPFAKGVSAKSHQFNDEGNDTRVDFMRMLKIVKEAGYTGYIGIEYEGGFLGMGGDTSYLSDDEGILATKRLLEKVGAMLS